MRAISSESLTHMAADSTKQEERLSHTGKKAWLTDNINTAGHTDSHRFHFSNFRYFLTLFSKFFSSFPHGTCSLSVSYRYLALDGIYHPLRAAIPNNSTRREPDVHSWHGYERGYHPPRRSFPRDFTRYTRYLGLFRLQFRRFSVWASPASLAVTKGILVSFFSSA